ncbi:MAG: hypothetical protein J5765_02935 [Clostridia bacterium]|nr:hypothetical protein [Clostridia bacterium]
MLDHVTTNHQKTILFGSYPQSLVTEEALIRRLNEMAGVLPTENRPEKWTSYHFYYNNRPFDFCWYIDLTDGDKRYRGVYFSEWRPNITDLLEDDYEECSETYEPAQQANGYKRKTVYWFLFEPIEWRVLYQGEDLALLLSCRSLDAREFFHATDQDDIEVATHVPVDPNDYSYSDLRFFLTEIFYRDAFSERERERIVETEIINDTQSTVSYDQSDDLRGQDNPFVCKNTSDKLFALSVQEVTDPLFGFDPNPRNSDSMRRVIPTDYAQALGAGKVKVDCPSKGYGGWWLRSPDKDCPVDARYVMPDGSADWDDGLVTLNNLGVVPALWIKRR